MVASKQVKFAALAMSLGITFYAGINQAVEAKSSKKSSSTSVKAGAPSDEQAVKAALATFTSTLDSGDAKALAALWTEDGEYTDEDGHQVKGHEDLEKRFSMVFSADRKPDIQMSADSIKFAAPTVALVEGTVQRQASGQSRPASHFSMVMIKTDKGWQLSRASETPIVASSNYDNLRNFDWIIGDWSAKSAAATVNMKAEWVPSKNFIVCKYETKKANGAQSIDMQIIGWDPILEVPRSWHFDSAGGYGQGIWSKANNQWVCDAVAVESDASTTKARNVITVTGPDSFTWTSVNRSVDGMAVGDAPELSVTRVR